MSILEVITRRLSKLRRKRRLVVGLLVALAVLALWVMIGPSLLLWIAQIKALGCVECRALFFSKTCPIPDTLKDILGGEGETEKRVCGCSAAWLRP